MLQRVLYAPGYAKELIGYYIQQGANPDYGWTHLQHLCSSALDIDMDDAWRICSTSYDYYDLSKQPGCVSDITDKACELVLHGAQLNGSYNCPYHFKKYFFGNTCCRWSERSQKKNDWQDEHAKKLLVLRKRLMDVWDTVAIARAKAMKARVYEVLMNTQTQPVCNIIASYVCVQEASLELRKYAPQLYR